VSVESSLLLLFSRARLPSMQVLASQNAASIAINASAGFFNRSAAEFEAGSNHL